MHPRSILHYFWDGETMPRSMQERLDRWADKHPSWQIRRWSSADFDFSKCLYAASACQQQLWAYCSDYVRLRALHEHGGIYLDTDVELLRSLEALTDGVLHIGYMHNCALGTAVISSPPGHHIIGDLLAFYEQLDGSRMVNNNAVFTEYFLQRVPCFKLDGRSWTSPGLFVHPKTDFEQPDFHHQGYAIHLFNQSWNTMRRKNDARNGDQPGMTFLLKRTVRSLLEEYRCCYLRYYLRDRYNLPVRRTRLTLSFDTSRLRQE